jgi:hypothetical protein
MQIVYLSARPGVLAQTLPFVAKHLPFVDRGLVITPAHLAGDMAALGLEVVTDEELLGGRHLTDHQRRNYALRAALGSCDLVADLFLSTDDDSRPLVSLPESTFLRDRAYGSHMPQMIDKALLAEVVALLAVAADRHPMDEWSTYLNVAGALHPERFEDPEPYLTLGWPDDTSTWQATLDPAALHFENFLPQHYLPGQVFAGIDPADTSYEAAVDKVVRWRRYELEVLAGERPPALAQVPEPSAVGQVLRKARTKAVGDPTLRDRQLRAATAAALRAQRRG